MESEKLSPLQKADKIRLILRKKRYPALSSRRESFDSLLKKLRLPKTVAVKPSPFFEEDNFSVNFSFGNRKELINSLLKLQELASKQELSAILKIK
jgi:hypothetical protein